MKILTFSLFPSHRFAHVVIILVMLLVTVSACNSHITSTAILSPTSTPTPLPIGISTSIFIPTSTPTATATQSSTITPSQTSIPSPSATPSPKLPVSLETPIPIINQPININNAPRLQMLANYLRFDPGMVMIKLTADEKYYFVVNSKGIDIYDTSSARLIRHENIILRLNYVHDGYYGFDLQLASDGSRFMARVSDSKTAVYTLEGQEIYSYTFPPEIFDSGGSGMSPDGRFLAIDICSEFCDRNIPHTFTIYDIDNRKVVYEWGSYPGGEARGRFPIFSPDGKVMATNMGAQWTLWDTTNWKRITDFGTVTIYTLNGLSFSPDSTLIAVSGATIDLSIWSWKEHKLLHTFKTCRNGHVVPEAIISPDNAYIAILNCQKVVIWNIADGSQVSEQDTIYADITGMSIGTDGKLTTYEPQPEPDVVYASWNSWPENLIFHSAEKQSSWNLEFTTIGDACSISKVGQVNCVEGSYFLDSAGEWNRADSNDHNLELIQGMAGNEISMFSFQWSGYMIEAVSLDITHKLLFYETWSNPNYPIAQIMDMTKGKMIYQWDRMYIRQLTYSPDGKLAAFTLSKNPGSRLILYDLGARMILYQVDSAWNALGSLAFSPDGRSLLYFLPKSTDTKPDVYYIMNLDNRAKSTRYQLYDKGTFPTAARYSPDGSMLMIGFSDGRIRIINTQDASVIHEWNANTDRVSAITFSENMSYFVSASIDGNIRIWGIWP